MSEAAPSLAADLVTFCFAVAASPAAFANALDDFLAFNAQARTATARFDQQVFDQRGKVVDRSSGTFLQRFSSCFPPFLSGVRSTGCGSGRAPESRAEP